MSTQIRHQECILWSFQSAPINNTEDKQLGLVYLVVKANSWELILVNETESAHYNHSLEVFMLAIHRISFSHNPFQSVNSIQESLHVNHFYLENDNK